MAQPPQSPLSPWKVAVPGCCAKQWPCSSALIFRGTYDSKKRAFNRTSLNNILHDPTFLANSFFSPQQDRRLIVMNDQDSIDYVIQQHTGRAKRLEYLPSRTTAWPVCAIWLLAHQYSLQHAPQNVRRCICQTWGSGFHGFWWTMPCPCCIEFGFR